MQKTFEFLSFETKPLRFHSNSYISNLCNTIPLIHKQESLPVNLIVSLGSL